MYRDLTLTNFRGFRRFTMEGLGRINLLVGPNNCGKTTVLEAIDLLADYPDPVLLGAKCIDRSDVIQAEDKKPASIRLSLRHLFHGHSAKIGSQIEIEGHQDGARERVRVSLADGPEQEPPPPQPSGTPWLIMTRESGQEPVSHSVQLTANAEWQVADWQRRYDLVSERFRVVLIGPGSLNRSFISDFWATVALNPEEQLVLNALRILEPRIDGLTILAASGQYLSADRSGIFVKLKGQRERIPIGSLGEGMWRLLALALGLVDARGSLLLVDEIDIGLHYSAQADMWRMVKQAAEELDVQVFATTHSRDCIEALAQIARPDVTTGSEVTIQRIEGERAVAYSEREIVLAAERGIEVR